MNTPAPWPPTSGTLPWTRSCFVCGDSNPRGLRLRSRIEGDRVVIRYATQETDLGYRHIIHGGIAMTLLDEVMTWAAILSARAVCVAAEVTARLRKPIVAGQSIRVEGRMTERRYTLYLTEGRVLDGAGSVLATARGKYVPMPSDQLRLCVKDFVPSPESISPTLLFDEPPPPSGDQR
jgi:uncharacterized protein (TIGR00369 family)